MPSSNRSGSASTQDPFAFFGKISPLFSPSARVTASLLYRLVQLAARRRYFSASSVFPRESAIVAIAQSSYAVPSVSSTSFAM